MKSKTGEIIAAVVAAGVAATVAAAVGCLVGMFVYGVMLRDMGADKGFESAGLVVGATAFVFAVVAFIVVYKTMTVYSEPPDGP